MTLSRIVPVAYQADAVTLLERLADLPFAIAFDSAGRDRWDIVSAAPTWLLIRTSDGHWQAQGSNPPATHGSDFDVVQRAFASVTQKTAGNDLPFEGGLLGYLGYEFAHDTLYLPCSTNDDLDLPLAFIGHYPWAVVTDHDRRQTWLVVNEDHDTREQDLLARLSAPDVTHSAAEIASAVQPDIDRNKYERCIAAIRQYLLDGDTYQVNFAQRYRARLHGSSLAAFRSLKQEIPSPFSAFLDLGTHQILCISPERFLRCNDRHVLTQPIKGTRPRDDDPARDLQQATELQQSAKDRAENVMIVDLLRNDLGQVCTPGSIQVEQLFELQSFSNVHHLVSTVSGTLADDYNIADLLLACFPGGSITGAPKRRAMQIIDELETHRRTIYCGSMFYLSKAGRFDSNIAIRTLLRRGTEVFGWSGSGIVFDSDAAREFDECEHKIRRLFDALKP